MFRKKEKKTTILFRHKGQNINSFVETISVGEGEMLKLLFLFYCKSDFWLGKLELPYQP